MNDIFDNRELSFLVWLIIAIALMMLKPSVRNDIFRLLQTAFDKKLVIIYLWMISYIGLIIYVLFKISLWNTDQIKNTVIWIFFTGIGTLLKVNTVGENKNFFKDALKDVFLFHHDCGIFSRILYVQFLDRIHYSSDFDHIRGHTCIC